MRKNLLAVLVALSMVVMLAGTAARPLSGAVLKSIVYVPGKGPVFTFTVDRKFSKSELQATVQVEGGADFAITCAQVDAKTVKCIVPKKTAGENVVLSWGGGTFWAQVPGVQEVQYRYCYNVYDYDLSTVWKNYGTHCQRRAAKYGEVIPWYNPDWDDTSDHVFQPDKPCAGIVEDAYYYYAC